MKNAVPCFVFALISFLGTASLSAQLETPDDLEVGGDLPGPLGVYYPYEGEEAAFINVRIVNNRFRCYFLDSDQKTIMEPEWPAAVIHYGNAVRKGLNKNTTVMRKVEEKPYLYGVRFIPPPDRYWIQVILQNKADEEATNNYNQPAPAGAKRMVFKTEILNQLAAQKAGASDGAVGDNFDGIPTSNY
ncbi:hypothetical protein [Rubellicoccus peritrichatus]|uniref:DUF928 domain-containing protein n=1 Tax=Rubellicoccus peritrichatus TaxID=3080537 RepID=A0AAQ3LCC2_9BACT|nr:hypothetical protein [Puniceicoccus sp. CR14]WOO42836.1 hypothetical protein RZN69_07005 [Puniceicoccus sp. CR14]